MAQMPLQKSVGAPNQQLLATARKIPGYVTQKHQDCVLRDRMSFEVAWKVSLIDLHYPSYFMKYIFDVKLELSNY